MSTSKINFLMSYFYTEFINYPVYMNLSYFWNFGVIAFFRLFIQMMTGIFLAMHYMASPEMAFLSVEHMMSELNYGWLISYLHANGASFFFLAVYIHFFRNLYYNSFINPREVVWMLGVIIMLIMILTAFLGYVLPWGQMSFWAATVMTSIFSAIPFFGESMVIWLWGGYAVDSATLTSFFSLHYLFPFILIFLVILHVLFLHEHGSTNPMGLVLKFDKVSFSPYYMWKDFLSIILFIFLLLMFVFFYPNYLGHADNYMQANALVTPAHIVPEWYFLPLYAILRSIPNKLGGILMLFCAIFILIILPFMIMNSMSNKNFYIWQQVFFWNFLMVCLLLGWLGGQPVEYPYLGFGQLLTFFYFFHFFILVKFIFMKDYLELKGLFMYQGFVVKSLKPICSSISNNLEKKLWFQVMMSLMNFLYVKLSLFMLRIKLNMPNINYYSLKKYYNKYIWSNDWWKGWN